MHLYLCFQTRYCIERVCLTPSDVQTANAEEELARVKPCFLHPPSHLPKPLDPSRPVKMVNVPKCGVMLY
jgi:hypothetical protein